MLNEIVNDMKIDSINQAQMQQSRDAIENQLVEKYYSEER